MFSMKFQTLISLKSKMLQEMFQSIAFYFIPLRMLRRRRTTMTRRKRTRTEKERMGKTAKAGKTARAVKTRREKTAKETRRKRRRMRRKNRKFSLNEMVEETFTCRNQLAPFFYLANTMLVSTKLNFIHLLHFNEQVTDPSLAGQLILLKWYIEMFL